jgi:antitoxin MazE
MIVKLQKWGNSMGVRISKKIIDDMDLSAGSVFSVEQVLGNLVLKPENTVPKYDIALLSKQINQDNQHKLIDTGHPVGAEIW